MHYPKSFKDFGKHLQRDSESQFSLILVIPGIMRNSLQKKQNKQPLILCFHPKTSD